jgi:hypothetical protein
MMAPRRKPCTETLSLLDYEAPRISEGFDPGQVRAASLESSLALAISVALKEKAIDRAEVARRMNDYLGADAGSVTVSALNSWTSQAKSDHVPSAARLVALCAVLGDIRPLALLAEQLGYAVVEPRYVHFVRGQMLRDKAKELAALADAEMRAAR